ncbi:MAG: polysaccharide lyase family 7 protein [Chthoniobacter sp.]|uniref:polysaccharide lyase family 7 protein n=1 Tax=Chthoniobacter sp. TaxID=2510640 RepID=UPI0032A2210E
MKSQLLPLVASLVLGASRAFCAEAGAPSQAFDLHEWKLQVPGPLEVKDLRNYSSGYFFLNGSKEMGFALDAAEKGATPNTKYVRSELRHIADWTVDGSHTLTGEVRVVSHLKPDKVTVLQIHGITPDGDNAPPLLRIALNKGDLYAALKPDNTGDKTDMVLLKAGVKTSYVKVAIVVKSGQLHIAVDGQEKLKRDLSYWKFSNYFKAGLYPQATTGTAQVFFRSLKVE